MTQLFDKILQLERQVARLKKTKAFWDLDCMLGHVKDLQTEISKEDVECRRLRRTTLRRQELDLEIQNCVQNLEHHLTMAALMWPVDQK